MFPFPFFLDAISRLRRYLSVEGGDRLWPITTAGWCKRIDAKTVRPNDDEPCVCVVEALNSNGFVLVPFRSAGDNWIMYSKSFLQFILFFLSFFSPFSLPFSRERPEKKRLLFIQFSWRRDRIYADVHIVVIEHRARFACWNNPISARAGENKDLLSPRSSPSPSLRFFSSSLQM